MPSTPPSKSLDQFVVRFPEGMRDRIKEEAEKNGRSMNAEIVYRLEQSFAASDKPDDLKKLEWEKTSTEKQLQGLRENMERMMVQIQVLQQRYADILAAEAAFRDKPPTQRKPSTEKERPSNEPNPATPKRRLTLKRK